MLHPRDPAVDEAGGFNAAAVEARLARFAGLCESFGVGCTVDVGARRPDAAVRAVELATRFFDVVWLDPQPRSVREEVLLAVANAGLAGRVVVNFASVEEAARYVSMGFAGAVVHVYERDAARRAAAALDAASRLAGIRGAMVDVAVYDLSDLPASLAAAKLVKALTGVPVGFAVANAVASDKRLVRSPEARAGARSALVALAARYVDFLLIGPVSAAEHAVAAAYYSGVLGRV